MHPYFTRFLTFTLCAAFAAACSDPFRFGHDDQGSGAGSSTGSGASSGSAGSESFPTEVSDVLNLPSVADDYAGQVLPAHFNTQAVLNKDNTPANNPIDNRTARLGRVLFYDVNLSQNRSIACASCHDQQLAFGDDVQLSSGFDGGSTGRNSMSLVNVRFYNNRRMFWDERAASLEDQVLMPIQDSVEMGLTLDELVNRVDEQAYYPYLFEQAFGDDEVTPQRISRALAQFVRSLLSYRSRFDEGLAQTGNIDQPFPNLTQQENQGKTLFLGPAGCGPCHLDNGGPGGAPPGGPLNNQAIFQLNAATNNGLDSGPVESDNGVGDNLQDPSRNGDFKAPSLRNVALTAPYMHDGRFETLADVISFYNTDVKPHPNLDQRLRGQNGQPRQLNLSPQEQAALVAFLGTLSDESFVNEPMYADPFK